MDRFWATAPLRPRAGGFEFSQRAVQDFFCARALLAALEEDHQAAGGREAAWSAFPLAARRDVMALMSEIASQAERPTLLRWADALVDLLRSPGAAASAATAMNATGMRMCGLNLSGADLRGADLSGAVLDGADLRGADLRGVNFSLAFLRNARLERCKMAEATFGELPFLRAHAAILAMLLLDASTVLTADAEGELLARCEPRDARLARGAAL